MPSVSLIIPTFNERDNVAPLIAEINRHLAGFDVDITFVDDSSDDTPAQVLEAASTSAIPVSLIHREVPTGGLSGAVVTGMEISTREWVVVMDGDGQHPPATVIDMLRIAGTEQCDVVVGSRYVPGGSVGGLDGRYRRWASTICSRLAKVVFAGNLSGCTDPMSGFFAVRRSAVDPTQVDQCGYKILLSILMHRSLRVTEVPLVFRTRTQGESKASITEGVRYLRLIVRLQAQQRRRTSSAARPAPVLDLVANQGEAA